MNSEEFQSQLASRAASGGVAISGALGAQLEAYYRLLAHWNASINLTALPLDPLTDQAIDRLLIEPVAAALQILKDSPVWYDLGSGGGSPAIPLKLARPGGLLTMVESKERKAAFLREAVRVLGIGDAAVVADRIELVAANPRLAGTVDLITIRAVRIVPALVEAIRTLLRFGGQVVFFGTKAEELSIPRGFEVAQRHPGASRVIAPLIVLNRVGP